MIHDDDDDNENDNNDDENNEDDFNDDDKNDDNLNKKIRMRPREAMIHRLRGFSASDRFGSKPLERSAQA